MNGRYTIYRSLSCETDRNAYIWKDSIIDPTAFIAFPVAFFAIYFFDEVTAFAVAKAMPPATIAVAIHFIFADVFLVMFKSPFRTFDVPLIAFTEKKLIFVVIIAEDN